MKRKQEEEKREIEEERKKKEEETKRKEELERSKRKKVRIIEEDKNASDGGNTSVDSLMEDTPSNYNAANQRHIEIEKLRQRAKRNMQN